MRARILGFLSLLVFSLPPALAAEGRTPVWLPGTVIAAPGRYIVTRNLFGGAPTISITTGNVDLDLNGMTLDAGGVAAPVIVVVAGGTGDVVIHDGTVLNGGENIAITAPGQRLVLEDLKIDGSNAAAIHIVDSQNFVIRRVTISGSNGPGIQVDGPLTKQGTIEQNLVRRTQASAIRVQGAASLAVVENRIEETQPVGGVFGIQLDGCDSCLVAQNTVHNTGDTGIFLRSFKGKVYNNTVGKAGSHGIYLDPASSDSLVLNNVVSGSGAVLAGGCGLFVDGDRIMIEGNALNANSGAGLRLSAASILVTFGRNTARGNTGVGVGPCAGAPTLFPPNSCNDGGGNTTFGTNLIPGPPVF
jgi:parallel beta-helix repeat protein